MISAAMEGCDVKEPIMEQQALIPHDVILVNGVQDPGFTPYEEFLPRSAPMTALSVSLVYQVPDISRKTLSALKDQIRIDRGQARELRIQAAEKEEYSKRSEQEEWRLSSQAEELDERLAKLRRQEARLNRKIYNLGKTRILTEILDQVEAKTKEANLLRSKAYNLAVSDIYNRTC